jgi:hypothetical protein
MSDSNGSARRPLGPRPSPALSAPRTKAGGVQNEHPARTRDEHGKVIYDPLQAAVAKADDAVLHHRLYELDDAIEGPTPEEERDAIREEIERRDADKLRRQQEFEARRAAAREKSTV